MIEVRNLTKRYGSVTAVDDLSFVARPGVVTGFLGPNGAGKSTTMRVLMGLDRASAGHATIGGKPYHDLVAPLREVGGLLEARAVHTSRSARNHLLALAATHAIPRSRVDQVLDVVGLSDVGRQRAGAFSLGMGQRLGLASALLGDPATLLLDEPVNGLDPEGVLWVRTLLKSLAAEGRTVFVSSHLMSEMALTATELVVVGRGRLIAAGSVAEVIHGASTGAVLVRTADSERLAALLAGVGVHVPRVGPDQLDVTGTDSAAVGRVAAQAGIALIELTPQQATLEEAFMEITRGAVQFEAGATSAAPLRPGPSGARP